MKEISKKTKIIYGVIAIIILIGIIMTFTLKLNFSLMYSDNTRIKVYLGKEYNVEDIKQIAEEVFGTKQIVYQDIEVFNESVSITVKEASAEQVEALTNKLQEKYEIETLDGLVKTSHVAHLRFSDMIKQYILPLTIATIIILVYVAIRYMKLEALKTVLTLALRMIVSEALFLSIIAIVRIPLGAYFIPVVIGIYLLVILFTMNEFQKKLENINLKESKK